MSDHKSKSNFRDQQSNSAYKVLKVKSSGPRLTITIHRPDALNALNADVLEELEEALLEEIDPVDHRVIVIEGSGDKAFVAGADISEMKEMACDDAQEFAHLGQSITAILGSVPQVVIAKVKGFALGGGCELAMACDLVVAGKSAKFGQPEVNLGLIAGFGGTQRLARRVGLPIALDMLLTGKGRTLTAEEALQFGLVSRVVDDDKLEAEIDRIVDAISKTGPEAVAQTKRLTRESLYTPLDIGLGGEAAQFALCFAREESKEGISAFLSKRTPNFKVADEEE
ncbi:MAG: enoyl-CoA hydratase-related protein [Proteobacteria bacterium]|nr:enoyl-CoA hydratase-related protein [Pseudomonadota bacterium]